MSFRKKMFFSLSAFLVLIVLIFFVLELAMNLFNPRGYLYPRYKFSEEYGTLLFRNVRIEHVELSHRRIYTTNDYGLRGEIIPISNSYDKKNIIILGDSYTFGIGVNDGYEFASIIRKRLISEFYVINTAIGGWGLTQQIRRFYEFGQLYNPKIVLLVFCGNDPKDNMKNQVTTIENGRFKFNKSNNSANWIKKYLSKSILLKSNVYNIIRTSLYPLFEARIVKDEVAELQEKYTSSNKGNNEFLVQERFYIDLLDLFAKDLNRKEIKLLMISINFRKSGKNISQLDLFPGIKAKVFELDRSGLLHYIDIIPWFKNDEDLKRSPVGHYGRRWNHVLGSNLSNLILKEYVPTENDE